MDTKNGGPVFWMSENYVCPNCVKEPGDRCCQSPPEGAFCTPDTRNMTQKTPQQLKRGCERFRFIPGLDETAGSYEIGLYFKFQSVDGFPTGCEGFNWREGRRSGFSSIEGKAWEDPGCPLQTLASPASAPPTSWYMKHYAGHQEAWLTDFAAAYDKMSSNGYGAGSLALVEAALEATDCTGQLDLDYSQCWARGDGAEAAQVDVTTNFAVVFTLEGI